MSNVSRRSGRKGAQDRTRELVALFSALSKTGDSVSIDAISSRLGVSRQEAATWMDIICSASGEKSPGLLISTNEEQTEFTLQYPASQGRPLRLTLLETTAVMHGLDECGVEETDPMRARLTETLATPDVVMEEITRALGESDHSDNLMTCMWAQVEERVVEFDYLGLRDAEPRRRRALIRQMRKNGQYWYIHAFDVEIGEDRNFRVDRMTNVGLAEIRRLPERPDPKPTRTVGIHFSDRRYYLMFNWEGLKVLSEVDGVIHAEIPYFGEHSPYLARRVCACAGTVVVDDERIMAEAREYARSMLEAARQPETVG